MDIGRESHSIQCTPTWGQGGGAGVREADWPAAALVLFRVTLHSSPEGCPRTDTRKAVPGRTHWRADGTWRSSNTKPSNESCQFSCSHDQTFYPLSFLFHIVDEMIALDFP
ncbi:unnamed protein product [Boreogadus saida]